MATVQIQTEVSLADLLQGVQELDSPTLEQFADEVMLLRAQRRAAHMSKEETELVRQINQGLPENMQKRFAELKSKREAHTLTSAEHTELVAIVDQIEQLNVERVKALAELAQLRSVSVRSLMQQMAISPNDG